MHINFDLSQAIDKLLQNKNASVAFHFIQQNQNYLLALKTIVDSITNNEDIVFYLNNTDNVLIINNSLDYIFSEHMIEHVSYEQGASMLRECYRTLKPGGRLRLATPDYTFLHELYASEKSDLQLNYIKWSISKVI